MLWRHILSVLLLTGCGTTLLCPGAEALQYALVSIAESQFVVNVRGPIVSGDFNRLVDFLAASPKSNHIVGFALDSPGGLIEEASKIELGFPHDFLVHTRQLVFGDTYPLIDNHRG